MYKTEEILSMLKEGKDADTIAKEFTDALNNAVQKQKEANSKLEDAKKIVVNVSDFLSKYYPEATKDIKFSEEEIEKVANDTLKNLDSLAEVSIHLKELIDVFPTPKEVTDKKNTSTEKIFEDFFQLHNLL